MSNQRMVAQPQEQSEPFAIYPHNDYLIIRRDALFLCKNDIIKASLLRIIEHGMEMAWRKWQTAKHAAEEVVEFWVSLSYKDFLDRLYHMAMSKNTVIAKLKELISLGIVRKRANPENPYADLQYSIDRKRYQEVLDALPELPEPVKKNNAPKDKTTAIVVDDENTGVPEIGIGIPEIGRGGTNDWQGGVPEIDKGGTNFWYRSIPKIGTHVVSNKLESNEESNVVVVEGRPTTTEPLENFSYGQGYVGNGRAPSPVLTSEGQRFYDLYCRQKHVKIHPPITEKSAPTFNQLGESLKEFERLKVSLSELLQMLNAEARLHLPSNAKDPSIKLGNLRNAVNPLLEKLQQAEQSSVLPSPQSAPTQQSASMTFEEADQLVRESLAMGMEAGYTYEAVAVESKLSPGAWAVKVTWLDDRGSNLAGKSSIKSREQWLQTFERVCEFFATERRMSEKWKR